MPYFCYSENKVLMSKINPIFGFRGEKVAVLLLIEPTLMLVLMKFMKPSVLKKRQEIKENGHENKHHQDLKF